MILEGMYAYGWTNAAVSNTPSRLRDALRRYCPTLLDPCVPDNLSCNHPYLQESYSELDSTLAFCEDLGANPTSKRQSRSMTTSLYDFASNTTSSGNTGAVSAALDDAQDGSLSSMGLITIPEPVLNFEYLDGSQDLSPDPAFISSAPWTSGSSHLDYSIDMSSGMLDLDQSHWNDFNNLL